MKKTFVGTLLVILVFPSVVFGLEDRRPNQVNPQTTKIIGVAAWHSERDLTKLFGNTKSSTSGFSEIEGKPWKELHYHGGLKVFVVEGDIYGLSCTGANCETDRGVKVGDSKARVIEVYGSGNPPYPGAREHTVSYPLTGSDSYLVFVFRNKQVVEIQFFMDYM